MQVAFYMKEPVAHVAAVRRRLRWLRARRPRVLLVYLCCALDQRFPVCFCRRGTVQACEIGQPAGKQPQHTCPHASVHTGAGMQQRTPHTLMCAPHTLMCTPHTPLMRTQVQPEQRPQDADALLCFPWFATPGDSPWRVEAAAEHVVQP